MYSRILIPTDGSDFSKRATQEGLDLAKALGAKLCFFYVAEDPVKTMSLSAVSVSHQLELFQASKALGEAALDAAIALAEKQGVPAERLLIEGESPVNAILNAADDVDLIVIGTHGRRGFNRFMFGSVAEGVIRQSSTPCLIIRGEEATS